MFKWLQNYTYILFIAFALHACATAAQQESASMQQSLGTALTSAKSCQQNIYTDPQYASIKKYFVQDDGFTIEQLSNQSVPTTAEAKIYVKFYKDLKSCQRIITAGANQASLLFSAPFQNAFSNADNVVVDIAQRKTTWGQALQRQKAIADKLQQDVLQTASQIDNRLEASHQSEIAQRQRAAVAMQQSAYQQQMLNQNQQLINNMNRPVTTNCNNFGSTVNCTSY